MARQVVEMNKFIFFFMMTLALLCAKTRRPNNYLAKNQFKITTNSFREKHSLAFYNSFLFGNKSLVLKKDKEKFKDLGLMHLMTPSGLHFNIILFLLSFLMSKFDKISRYSVLLEIYLGFLIYALTPGLYAFKRFAFLFAARKINKHYLKNFFSRTQVISLVFLYDYFLGTLMFQTMSYLLSLLFIGILNFRNKSKFLIYYHLFLGQVILSYIFSNKISIMNLFISPILTFIFSCLYPLLVGNLIFIDLFNYSQYLISFFLYLLNIFHGISQITPYFKIDFISLVLLISLNRKNFIFILCTLFLLKANF